MKLEKEPEMKAETRGGLSEGAQDAGFTTRQALPALFDLQVALALVIGGCCSYVPSKSTPATSNGCLQERLDVRRVASSEPEDRYVVPSVLLNFPTKRLGTLQALH